MTRRLAACAATLTALAILACGSTQVFAAPKVVNDTQKLVSEPMPIRATANKITFAKADGKGGVSPMASQGPSDGSLYGSGSRTISPAGSSGSLAGWYGSYATWNWLDTRVNLANGYSKVRWYGSTPYNASLMQQTDRLYVSALNVSSISLSTSSVGMSITKDSRLAYFTDYGTPNTWRNDHYPPDVSFDGLLFSCGQSLNGYARFGYSSYYFNW